LLLHATQARSEISAFADMLKNQFQSPSTRQLETQSRAGLLRCPSKRNGGADRDRTDDILLAKQALSQLSYSPMPETSIADPCEIVVGLDRLELSTSPLSGVRSSQLSYRPGSANRPFASWLACSVTNALLEALARELSRRFSRTQLNVRSGYAESDHRC
jgi:hypothetical protein